MLKLTRISLLCFAIIFSLLVNVKAQTSVVINEFMASNNSIEPDPQGEYDDWIEIYNTSSTAVNIGGMYLTDDLSAPNKWQFPDPTIVPAGGFLLVWADCDVGDNGLHAAFKLSAGGEEIALFEADGSTLIDSVTYSEQTIDISYGRYPNASDNWKFLSIPTPGAGNEGAYSGKVEAPRVSHNRGFYDEPFTLTIATETEGASIFYTIDGSSPYDAERNVTTGISYTMPVTITETTCLRAVAIKERWLSSRVITYTYIFISDVIRQSSNGERPGPDWPRGNVNGQEIDYGMDPDVVNDNRYSDLIDDALLSVPSISLVTEPDNLFDPTIGIYVNALEEGRDWERPVSVELLNPDGSEDFQINAGMRIRGGWRRRDFNPKHPFRLFFRAEYGDTKLRFPLFEDEGVEEFENVDLRTSQNYSWASDGDSQNTMVREVFSRDVQGMMGHPYTRSRYYHLYINGQYWGLHQTQERSEASYAASYFDGSKEDYDVMKMEREEGLNSMIATDGNTDAYRRLYDEARTGLENIEKYYRLQGLNVDGSPNPAYERLLDVDNLIDFMIIEYYTGDRDGPGSRFGNRPNNTYGIYNRENTDGWKWFHHDNEHTLGVRQSEENMVTPFTWAGAQWRFFNPHWLHEQLITENSEYRMKFADHVYRHFFNNGQLTPERVRQLLENRINQIDMAIIAESARWGDAKRSSPFTKEHWQREIDELLDSYIPSRTQVVLDQFKSVGWYPDVEPPVIDEHGGLNQSSFELTISNANGAGQVYYTTDGSDPGQPDSMTDVVEYTGKITLTKSARIKARVISGNTWSALSDAAFTVGPVAENLRITEIMFHPFDAAQEQPLDANNIQDPNEEFIELKNIGAETINLNLVSFTDGVDFTFPDLELAGGEYVVVVENQNKFEARYGTDINVAGEYTGKLNNAGERITLVDAAGQIILNFRYQDGWYDTTDGEGFSLTVMESTSDDPNRWNDRSGWRPSVDIGGSPGQDDTDQIPRIGEILINEILAHSHAEAPDWIELYNPTDVAINISGWFLSDSENDLMKYEIAEGTIIEPDGYVVFYEDINFGNSIDPGCHVPFALSESGETLYLNSGQNGILTGYNEQERFDASETGIAFGRYRKSTGTYNFVSMSFNTPGSQNAYPKVGPIVISEIMYSPVSGDKDAEYIELLNISDSMVILAEFDDIMLMDVPWQFTDSSGITFDFPLGTIMARGEYLLLVKDENAFNLRYPDIFRNCQIIEWGGGRLSNAGERVQISKPGEQIEDTRYYIRIDRVNYSDGSHPAGEDPWPVGPDGNGYSLSRKDTHDYGNDVDNWQAAVPSPGW